MTARPQDVADLVKKHGAKVVPLQLGVTKPKDVANAVAKATDVALLINNAGIATNFGRASKAAAHSITQATRSHLRAQGTYVAGAYAGSVDTDMGKNIPMEKASPESAAPVEAAAA
jgi:short-subunit dehydrogenase